MNKVYDLAETAGHFRPLPLSGTHRRSLQLAILRELKRIPGASRGILSTYSEKVTEWDVPPLYAGTYNGVGLQVGCESPKWPDKTTVLSSCVTLLKTFQEYGLGGRLPYMLSTRFGKSLAENPWTFSGKDGVGRFATELAVVLSRAYPRGLLVGDGTLAVRVPAGDSLEYVGILNGEVLHTGERVSPADMFDWTLGARGSAVATTYGVYDRLRMWAEASFEDLEDVDKFRMALSLLKLAQDPKEKYSESEVLFESEVRNLKSKQVFEKPVAMHYDKFVEVRSLWVGAIGREPEEAFLDLFEALVPNFYDSEKFRKMFGKIPELKEELTKRQLERIDRGMALFTSEYLSSKRKSE